jgi:hypothetical protein
VLDLAHWALERVQDGLNLYEGTLNKFLMDDKGSTLIGACRSHSRSLVDKHVRPFLDCINVL